MNEALYRRLLAGETATRVLAGQALWRLSGPDRVRYLNGQVTQDVTALAPDQAHFAAVCTAKGRMEGALWIAAHGDSFYLDAAPELRDSLGPRLEKYLIADDAQFEDLSESWRLSHVFGAVAPPVPAGGFAVRHARFGLPGHDVWNPGGEPVVAGDAVEEDVVETLRLEHGIPRWDAELTAQTLPPEAGPVMLDAISYTKGCYVGQETIARLKSIGHVNRTLVFLRSATAAYPASGAKLAADDKEVGVVTSSGFSPRLGVGIALGYAPPRFATAGASLKAGGLALTVSPPLRTEASA
jgi:folate-binding protein YgfZ